ncbi:hypothetical protein [Paenibacillus taichungensis]|uniref:hypothetical protein n=1 Tax=Paenibacillus taichungensis TaxID=484184 RepID=UPI0028726C69|nr:hypothetical protein [Paenibacillus taichungensis]MDR9744090.1 hypothetical protein [Paenibacillus taichungensis]
MAEMIVGLSKSNAEMRTTIRYLDQIQRSTERLGRVRYQSLIKVNNELRTTGRRLESIYSTAVRLSRLRITPKIGLDDQLSPALDRALLKLNSFRNQVVKASGTVSVEVRQKVEVAMGKMNPASGPSMSVVIGSHNTTINNAAKEEDKKWYEHLYEFTDFVNNITDIGEKAKKMFGRKSKKDKASNPSKSTEVAEGKIGKNQTRNSSRTGSDTSSKPPVRKVSGGRGGGRFASRAATPTPAPTPSMSQIDTDTSERAFQEAKKMDRNRRIGGGKKSNLVSGLMSSSPMAMSNLFSGDGMLGKLGGGLAKGAGKLVRPISMLADVANIASAPPEERGRAVGSMIGGAAGTAIGSAIGSVISPVIGTYIGGAVGGWAGSAAGGWIGDKSKDIGKFMSNATEGVGNALSGAADYISEKTKNITDGISSFFGFGSKKEDKSVSVASLASPSQVATGPQMPPAYVPPALTMTGPAAYLNSKVGQSTSAGFMGTSVMQSQAMALGNGAQTNGKSSTMTVQISEDQMSSLSSYLKDFKTETTNQISVNVPQGAVQVTVRENAIDYDAISHQVGMRFAGEVRRAMENRKTIMA